MGTFNNKIEAEFDPPKRWELSRALSYKNEEIDVEALEAVGVKCPAHRITCKKGFKTDLASVPRIIWNMISPWDVARAAIIHDLLYRRIRQYRGKAEAAVKSGLQSPPKTDVIGNAKVAADNVFLMAMRDSSPEVPSWKINAAYYAVVAFGSWSIRPREDGE